MDWQLPAVAIVVALAIAYLVWVNWRVWRSKARGNCAGECGCSRNAPSPTENQPVVIEQLKLRGGR